MEKIILFFCCLFLFSCSDTAIKIPDAVLSKEKMAAVMLDVQLLETTMGTAIHKTEFELAEPPATDILKKNGTSKKQFDESFEFYSQYPELLVEVYQEVMENLSKMQAEVSNRE